MSPKMKMSPKQGTKMSQKRTIIVTSSIIALSLIFSFIFNIGNIRRGFASGTSFYSIADGNWEDPKTWSTTGYSGKAGTTYPQAGDYVNISGHTVSVQNADAVCGSIVMDGPSTNINVINGHSLSSQGAFQINMSGGSGGSSNLSLSGSSASGAGSKINIGGAFQINKSGGNNEINVKGTGNGIFNLSNGLQANYSGGNGFLNINLKNTVQLNITSGDMSLNYSGGATSIAVYLYNQARINTANLIFNSAKASKINVYTYNTSSINLTGSIIRQDNSHMYGSLNSNDTSAVNFKGSAPQTITANSGGDTLYMNNLSVNNTSSTTPQVTLSCNTVVTGYCNLTTGVLQTSSNAMLVLGTNATISAGSSKSYVHGPIKKTCNGAFTFPVGKSGKYAPVSISAPTAATTFVIEYFPTAYSDTKNTDGTIGTVSSTEYWDILRTSGTGSTNVTLAWNDAKFSGITKTTNLKVAHYNTTTKRWESMGQKSVSATATSGTITSNTVSSFSPFTFGSDGTINPLPVSLASYGVAKEGNTVKMSWTTATEINNDYFTIERSATGQDFTELERVKGHGNSNDLLSYEYTDQQPLSGTSYYRLKQTDFNGKYEIFNTKPVNFGHTNIESVSPNPFTDHFIINYTLDDDEDVSIQLYNMQGQSVGDDRQRGAKGANTYRYEGGNALKPGNYILHLSAGGQQVTSKLVKY